MAAPAIAHTQHWVADMVVGLNLCPFARAEMVVKVKEPQAVERAMLRAGQILE